MQIEATGLLRDARLRRQRSSSFHGFAVIPARLVDDTVADEPGAAREHAPFALAAPSRTAPRAAAAPIPVPGPETRVAAGTSA
jgi:hypothetical protein